MTDEGLVVSTQNDLAEVQVDCFEGCHDCSARSLCIGNNQNKGRVSVKNPVHAMPGDEVKIRIPEEAYSRALILFFGVLISAIFFGMGGGYLWALVFSLPSFPAVFIGLVCGLAAGGFILARIFRQKNKDQLYPVIVAIMKKGDSYGKA